MKMKGAHLAGLASRQVKSGKVGGIIALDPASPGFSIADANNRLARSDADYVQIIHTDTRTYGMSYPFGHGAYSVRKT